MEDRIEHRDLPFLITSNRSLWRKGISPPDEGPDPGGASTHSLEYHRDYTPARIWRVWKTHIGNMVRFDRHNKVPEN